MIFGEKQPLLRIYYLRFHQGPGGPNLVFYTTVVAVFAVPIRGGVDGLGARRSVVVVVPVPSVFFVLQMPEGYITHYQTSLTSFVYIWATGTLRINSRNLNLEISTKFLEPLSNIVDIMLD